MAKAWSLTDANFPTIQTDEEPRESIRKIVNYMSILTEQLKYSLDNEDKRGVELEEGLSSTMSALEKRMEALEQRGEDTDETA